jgi:predicted nucleotidyltransferase
MVEESVLNLIQNYLALLNQEGIHASQAILFGSHAQGRGHPHSDIDLVVIAGDFDRNRNRELVERLWILSARTDARFEPIACGEREWVEDDSRAILEIARREGLSIPYLPRAA